LNRKLLLLCAAIGIAAAAAPAAWQPPVRIAYNASASAPLGWYQIHAVASPRMGDYVLAMLPNDTSALAAQRGYLPAGLPVLKQVAAVAGQHVCARSDAILIDDSASVRVLRSDRFGRPLPAWHQCRRLIDGELFLLNANNAASFDSRYFGPVLASAVRGQAIPLWTWSAP
jgi:conjugative transfer signal peptidase TraF